MQQPHFFWGAVCVALGLLASALSARAEDARPVILISSSIQGVAVDSKALAQALGRNVSSKIDLGAQSCTKFCMVRSVCKGLRDKGASAVIVLEDRHNFMMIPNLRVHGKYRGHIMKWAHADEEALAIAERKAFVLPELTYGGFSPVNLGSWDFENNVEASFLPDIVRECGSSGVTLVVLLYPTVWNVENKTTPEMDKYRGAYAAYLERYGGRLLDYTACPGITRDMFGSGDHMNAQGRGTFTRLLGEDLQAVCAGKRGPRELTDPRTMRASPAPPEHRAAASAGAAGPSPAAVARAWLDQLREMGNRLQPVPGKPATYKDRDFFERNRALLVRMATVARKILGEYGTTPAAGEARQIVARYGLPEKPKETGNVSLTAEVTVESAPPVPDPGRIKPYVEAQRFVRCRVDRIVKGEYSKPSILIVHWAIQKAKKTASAQWKAGTRLRVEADLYDAHPELATITTFEDPADIDLVPHWVLKAEWLGDAGASPNK